MAIIGVRDLARTSKQILARVVDNNEPFLITRRGKPIAALVPVAPSQAESYLLASAPDFLKTRHAAEHPDPGRGTLSLDAVAEELGIEDAAASQAPAAQPDDALTLVFDDPFLRRQVEYVFGQAAAQSFLQHSSECLGRLAPRVKHTAAHSAATDPAASGAEVQALRRIHGLNQQLFRSALREALAARLEESVRSLDTEALPDSTGQREGDSQPALLAGALDEATAYVSRINHSIVSFDRQASGEPSMRALEIGLRAAVAARSGMRRKIPTRFGLGEDVLPGARMTAGTEVDLASLEVHTVIGDDTSLLEPTIVREEALHNKYLMFEAKGSGSFGKVIVDTGSLSKMVGVLPSTGFKIGHYYGTDKKHIDVSEPTDRPKGRRES